MGLLSESCDVLPVSPHEAFRTFDIRKSHVGGVLLSKVILFNTTWLVNDTPGGPLSTFLVHL